MRLLVRFVLHFSRGHHGIHALDCDEGERVQESGDVLLRDDGGQIGWTWAGFFCAA